MELEPRPSPSSCARDTTPCWPSARATTERERSRLEDFPRLAGSIGISPGTPGSLAARRARQGHMRYESLKSP